MNSSENEKRMCDSIQFFNVLNAIDFSLFEFNYFKVAQDARKNPCVNTFFGFFLGIDRNW